MKIIYPTEYAGLQSALRSQLNIHIDKGQRMSDWGVARLSLRQKYYAASDVLYLHKLHDKLISQISEHERHIYTYLAIPAIINKVTLEVEGYTDLLQYEKEDKNTTIVNRNWWLMNHGSR
jgi:ribonuclease D